MDRAYRRLVLLLGIIICIPSVVNTQAMSNRQYSELEYVLTRAAICEMEVTFNEPRQHKERFKQLCSCIGQLIHRKIFNPIQIMAYDRYQQEDFTALNEGVIDSIRLTNNSERMSDERWCALTNLNQDQVIQPVYDSIDLISYDQDNNFVNSQVFTSYKVILSKMNNKGISC